MIDFTQTERHDEPSELVGLLSDSALRRASNATIFARGRAYAASGAVAVTSDVPGNTPTTRATIRATVAGTEPYSTEVWFHDGELGGDCSCANGQDGYYCKHQVALALIWRDRLSGVTNEPDGKGRHELLASAPRMHGANDRRAALRGFLNGQSIAVLADRLLDLADRDGSIERELQQWRKLSAAPQDAADLKALVSDIMSPGTDFITWQEGYGYARRAEAVLPLLEKTRNRDPAAGLALSLHAMRRGWAVLQQADDSNGNIGGLIQAIAAEWVSALAQSGPQPAAFGETYLQLLLDDPFGCFDTARVEAAMGAAALECYRKAIAARWRSAKDAVLGARAERAALLAKAQASRKRAPTYERDTGRDVERTSGLWELERLHLQQLEAAGDVDAALAVMREDLSEVGSYLRVTAFLEKHGRLREAFANAEQGHQAFPSDSRLQEDLLRCYDREGRVEEAFTLRRKRFDDAPSVDRYQATLKAGAAAKRDLARLREELQAALVNGEVQALAQSGARPPHWRRGAAPGQRDVSLRAQVLWSEGRQQEAVALVQPPAYCAEGVMAHMARELGPQHNEQRVELLKRVFVGAMSDSKSPYRTELQMVKEIAGLIPAVRRAAWLEQLRTEYKAKRNFVSGLPAV